MVVERPWWAERIQRAWRSAPIVWLSGVRRVGKTTLARGLGEADVFNCDLPSVAAQLDDPEHFFRSVRARVVVLDEVHQLRDPSRILKIAADAFPKLRVLATGSSTLAATAKFRDSLTGRKRAVHLLPVLASELAAFGVDDLRIRLLRGGLPGALVADAIEPELYAEWLDSFYARDIQELFRVEKRTAFLMLVELLLRQSGGLAEITTLGRATGLSRPTVMSYLDILQATHAVTVLRPFHGGGRQELLHQPKIYGFDTGFVAHCRGWGELREDDCGQLWEHLVLESLQAWADPTRLHYWRDKAGREVDFVIPRRSGCDAIECKWGVAAFDPKGLAALRALHPVGRNFVVVPHVRTHSRRFGALEVTFVSIEALQGLLAK
jgi:predicted AAA+ superfamily ATPase